MEKYMVSDKPEGPWLELIITDSAQRALEHARAAFAWPAVWVAKMRPMEPDDVIPTKEVFIGEMMERVVELHGSTVAAALEEDDAYSYIYNGISLTVADDLRSGVKNIWLPGIKKAYNVGQNVKPGDFTKVSLKELT